MKVMSIIHIEIFVKDIKLKIFGDIDEGYPVL